MPFIIPILTPGTPVSKAYIEALTSAIMSDRCSDSPDIYGSCCVLHDLCYRFGINEYGQAVKKADADALLRRCMQSKSRLGRFSPVAAIYGFAVSRLGWKAYGSDVDRREPFETEVYGK